MKMIPIFKEPNTLTFQSLKPEKNYIWDKINHSANRSASCFCTR